LEAINRHAAETAIILIESGANTHVKNDENDTPLLLAVRKNGSTKLMKILVERGADKNATGKEGKISYDIAIERRFEPEEIEFLKP
jgi:ankyrin repeat protein